MSNTIKGYTIIAYPESMPEDWEERLNGLPFGYCCALHDKDVNVDEDGNVTPKKAHMHFFFQGRASAKQIKYIMSALGIAYMGQNVRSVSAMYDYLTHENNPTKYKYDRSIIQKSAKWCQEAFDDEYKPKVEYVGLIMNMVEEKDIYEYCDLLKECYLVGDDDLLKEAKSLWCMRYIDSRRNKGRAKKRD